MMKMKEFLENVVKVYVVAYVDYNFLNKFFIDRIGNIFINFFK